MFQSFSIIFLLAAVFSYVNYRWMKLPSTIGIMILSLLTALAVIASEPLFPNTYEFFCDLVLNANFKNLLLDAMLSLLLFAGALHVDIADLQKEKWSVLLFATIGVLLSTFIVGYTSYFLFGWIGVPIPLLHSFLFGALISPTDPIAVIAILKKAGVNKSLQLKIEGESLFNDGIGVVVFTGLLLFASNTHNSTHAINTEILYLFVEEVIGGLALGGAIGVLAFRMIHQVEENAQLCIILTIGFALGGYSLASLLHTSGPLAMVVAGLYLGHKIFHEKFNTTTREHLDQLWEVLDEALNAVLFVMIGLAIHLLSFSLHLLLAAIISIFVVLAARWVSVILPFSIISINRSHEHFFATSGLLTWGGLKGGISLALALSLSNELSGDIILVITYCIVLFSILVQGLSLGTVVKKLMF